MDEEEKLNDMKLHELEKAKLDAEIKNLVIKRKEKDSSSQESVRSRTSASNVRQKAKTVAKGQPQRRR